MDATSPDQDIRSGPPTSPATRGLVYFVAWTIVALATTELQYFAQPPVGAQSYGHLVRLALASCWLWALFTPAILSFSRRVRIDRSSWPRTVPIHLVAAAVVTFIDVALVHEIAPLVNPNAPTNRAPLYIMFLRQLFLYSVCYFVIVALGHVRYYAGLSYERDLRALQLEGQLTAARLTALQGQLRPHFLFNTLNMIAEQVYTDPAGADAMLTRLGVLLRSSFVETDRERVPLRRELELLQSYVEIMQGRFRGRLAFNLDVEPATLDALVPRFVLQPLVENAIKHGVEPREEGGRVAVTARKRDGAVLLEVRDNGDGLGAVIREGTGVRNTRERLFHLYGDGRQRFELTAAPGGGTIASLEIPFERDDGPPATYTTPMATEATLGVRRSAPSPVVAPSALGRTAS
ncbi:MAG TPA: histidine kinase [Gemmatimonadaceae bacterium]|nr:histidine kinase [Gemmatimonadaceae bacterium]